MLPTCCNTQSLSNSCCCRVRTILDSSPAPSQRWRSTVFSRWGALGMRLHRSATAPPVTLAAQVGAAGRGSGGAANGTAVELQGQPAQRGEGAAVGQQESKQEEQQRQPSARFMDVVRAAASFKAAGSAASLRAEAEEDGSSGAADEQTVNSVADGPATDATAAAESAAAAAAAAVEAGEAGGELAAPAKPLPAVSSSSALSIEGSQPSEGPAGSPPRQVGFGALPQAATTPAPQHAKPAPSAQKSKLIRRCAGRWAAAAASGRHTCAVDLGTCRSALCACLEADTCPAPTLAPMQHQHAEARRSRGLAAGETQQVETPCISMQSMQLVSCL